jgi:hypothetical protein
MKKFVQALFILFSTIALGVAVYYFVQTRSEAVEANRPLASRKLVIGQNSTAPDASAGQAEREAATNHISALPNEVILDVMSVNLDQNEGDEQILTVRKTDRPGDRLSIVVAAYIPQRRGWVRAWEGDTLATKLTTFQITTEDLIGDHNLDIICSGMDDSNNQTLTVFRRVPGPDPLVIFYAPVCALSADSVVVEQVDRTEGYQLGQTNGASWPIAAFRHDKDSQNLLDQIKTTYSWDFRRAAYVEAGSEKIPGAQVEKEAAAKVLTGVEADFERFLKGAWVEAGKTASDPTARMLVFDRSSGSIIFYSPDDQEDYDWNESHSTRYGLYVSCQNESVTDLRRLMDIELTGADTISVRVFEDLQMKVDSQGSWDGTYTKVSPDTVSAGMTAAQGPAFKLSGGYRGADGSLLQFDGQHFTLQTENTVKKGGYILYTLGNDTVLQLSVISDSGLLVERKVYRALYTETKTGRSTSRHLQLSPASAAIDGLVLLQEPELSLDQRSGS